MMKYKNKKEIYLNTIKISNSNMGNIIAFDDSYGSVKSGLEAGIRKMVRDNKCNFKHLDSP